MLLRLYVAGGQSPPPLPFSSFVASMRLSLLLAFLATLVTLVFASYVHQSFPSLNAVDVAGFVAHAHLEIGTRYAVARTWTDSESDMGVRVGRLRDIRSSVCSGKV